MHIFIIITLSGVERDNNGMKKETYKLKKLNIKYNTKPELQYIIKCSSQENVTRCRMVN